MTGGVEDGGIDWDAARQAEANLSRLSLYGLLGLIKRSERHPGTELRVIHLEDDSTPPSVKAGNHSETRR
jgi:hypothetical protein